MATFSELVGKYVEERLFYTSELRKYITEASIFATEYYKGGIFEIKNSSSAAKSSSATTSNIIVPDSFDWRNVNGENWMTSVKNQGDAGTCWAFADVGGMEAQINLYYNLYKQPNPNAYLASFAEFDGKNHSAKKSKISGKNRGGAGGTRTFRPGRIRLWRKNFQLPAPEQVRYGAGKT